MLFRKIVFVLVVTTLIPLKAEDRVSLRVKSIGCQNNCISNVAHCLSSIDFNSTEYSRQSSGLNVAAISTDTWNVKVKSFDTLSGWFVGKKKREEFVKFFKHVGNNTIIVIVSQNMCHLGYEEWYDLLVTRTTGLFPIIEDTIWASHGTIVACKGVCPPLIEGTLPYVHFGYDEKFENTFVFDIAPVVTPTASPTRPMKIDENTDILPVIICSVVIVLAVLFTIFLVCFFKKKRETIYKLCFKKAKPTSGSNAPTNHVLSSLRNVSYGRQCDIIPLTNNDDSCQEYENMNEYDVVGKLNPTNGKNQNENLYEYICPEEKSSINEYYRASPITENTYYDQGNIASQTAYDSVENYSHKNDKSFPKRHSLAEKMHSNTRSPHAIPATPVAEPSHDQGQLYENGDPPQYERLSSASNNSGDIYETLTEIA